MIWSDHTQDKYSLNDITTVTITRNKSQTLFTGSHCGFWRRIKELSLSECALRTPEGRPVLWTFQGDSTWFFRARTRYTVPITHNYNHTLFTDGHCGFWRRIKGYRYQNLQSNNTWGEVSALNHPCRGKAHDSFKKIKLSFPFRPRTNGKVLGTTGCCQNRTALLRWGDLNL